ncbi:MAG: hypothetical protein AAFX92_04875 [Pseudomonadota bacterium]
MRKTKLSVLGPSALAVLVALAASPAAAQQETPNLEGTWTISDGRVLYWDGSTNHFAEDYVSFQVVISDQHEGVFQAAMMPVHDEDAARGYHGDEQIGADAYPMLGVIGWDGTTVVFADVEDTSASMCQLTDANTMQCIGWEAGERALAARSVLTRASD